MSTITKHETDVLIVGAGPTGLVLACELLRRGVRCNIIDKVSAPATTSRALGLQPRTLELFDAMGVVDQVLSTGGPVSDANLYDGDRLLLTLSTAGVQELDTPYPRLWITPQTSVEWPLEARLGELGGAVERAREFVGLREENAQVIATVKRGDGDVDEIEEIRASWLVGCDGAHSQVRKTLGVAFEGNIYEERFLLADVDLDWSRRATGRTPGFRPMGCLPSSLCPTARSGASSLRWKVRWHLRSRWSSSGGFPGAYRRRHDYPQQPNLDVELHHQPAHGGPVPDRAGFPRRRRGAHP